MNCDDHNQIDGGAVGQSEEKQRLCPRCHATMPQHVGYETWCDRCNWYLEVPEPPPWQTLFDRLSVSISRKSSQHLHDEMMKGRSLEAAVTPARILAVVIAVCVHAVTLALVTFGLWLSIFALPDLRPLGLLIAIPLFVLAWLLRPHFPKAVLSPLPPKQFPTLHRVTHRVAQALDARPLDSIVYDMHYNAGFGRVGWGRKRRLLLGLPLLSVLNGQEKIALLSHELAHSVNGDPKRTLLIGTSIRSLATWYELVDPTRRWRMNVGPATILLFLANLASLPLAGLIRLVAYALSHLLWYDSQRAEYLADLLAAKTSGTDALLATLTKVQLQETFRASVRAAYLFRNFEDFFTDLKRRVSEVPRREIERIRRLEELALSRVGASHPTIAHRQEFLEANYVAEPEVTLSFAEAAELEQELHSLLQESRERMFEQFRMASRELPRSRRE